MSPYLVLSCEYASGSEVLSAAEVTAMVWGQMEQAAGTITTRKQPTPSTYMGAIESYLELVGAS